MLNNSKTIIKIKTMLNVKTLKTVFFILINISNPAFVIKNATQAFIPVNAYAIYLLAKIVSKNKEIIKIIINDGNTTPNVAIKLPKIFF